MNDNVDTEAAGRLTLLREQADSSLERSVAWRGGGDDKLGERGFEHLGIAHLIPKLGQSQGPARAMRLALHADIRPASVPSTVDVNARLGLPLPAVAHGVWVVPLGPEEIPAEFLQLVPAAG